MTLVGSKCPIVIVSNYTTSDYGFNNLPTIKLDFDVSNEYRLVTTPRLLLRPVRAIYMIALNFLWPQRLRQHPRRNRV